MLPLSNRRDLTWTHVASTGETIGGGQTITVRAAVPQDYRGIAELMVECFHREFCLMFGRRLEAAVAVVEEVVGLEGLGGAQAIVAQDSTSVIGMLLLEAAHRARLSMSWPAMWRIARGKVGLWHLPRLLLGVALLSYHAEPGEAYISSVGVTCRMRGQGVGTRLLQAAEDWARDNDMTQMGLHVVSENAGARSLYRREGFRERGE